MKAFISSLILLFPLSLLGFVPSYYDDSRIVVQAEWLYFSPTSETSYYAVTGILTSPIFSGDRVANRLDDFYSGYRVSAAYISCWCDAFLSGSWTHFDAKHSDSLTRAAADIFPVIGPPGIFSPQPPVTAQANQASSTKKFKYDAADVQIGLPWLCHCCLNVVGFGGIHYADLSSKEEIAYSIVVPTVSTVTEEIESTFWGVGPKIGIAAESEVFCGFYLRGTVTGAVLIGKPKSVTLNRRGTTASFDITNQTAWRMVPYSNIRLGLKYSFDSLLQRCGCDCIAISVEAGYEVPVYYHALSNITFVDTFQLGTSIDDYRNVTMHGPYVALTVGF